MDAQNKPKKWHLSVFEYVELFVMTLAVVILVLTFAVRICSVGGNSMNNTLHDAERVVVSDLFYTPKQGDIIVFHETDDRENGFNKPIVKRVIATEGQFVYIDYDHAKIYVSDDNQFTEDEVLDESAYLDPAMTSFKKTIYLREYFEVPEGQLFVMGDNRNPYASADSRSDVPGYGVGFVEEERVLGKVLFRLSAPFRVQ